MKTVDLLKLGSKALLDRKVRSTLTIIGIMIGSAIILALIASTSGLSAGVQENIAKIGANTLIVRAGGANFLSGSTSSYQLSNLDLPILKGIPNVLSVTPVYSRGVSISVGGQTLSGQLFGIDLKLLPSVFKGITLSEGSYPQAGDPTSAVIGNGVAFPVTADGSQLIGVNQAVSMKIGTSETSLSFLVKGILAPYGSALFANVDNNVFVSLQAAQILLKTPYYSSIYISVDSTDNVASVQTAIQNIYGTQINIINAGSIATSISAVTTQITIFLGSIGSVVLFVAAIGIANTMYVAVMERTREIGILKALGFKGAQIMSMFLTEAAITGVVGGILGTGLGFILAYAMGGSLSFGGGRGGGFVRGGGPGPSTPASPPIFSIQLIIFSLVFPIAMSILAGLYPAWRASKMNIVNALKYE
jgi:putative ABC transport system permease protein